MNRFILTLAITVSSLAAQAQSDNVPPAPADTVLTLAPGEIEAEYPGGSKAWIAYLQQNLNAEAASRDVPKKAKRFTQTAQVQFVVNADGTLSDIKVLNDVLPSIRMEAIRVIRRSGTWVPAQQGGRNVKAYRTQPIGFLFE